MVMRTSRYEDLVNEVLDTADGRQIAASMSFFLDTVFDAYVHVPRPHVTAVIFPVCIDPSKRMP